MEIHKYNMYIFANKYFFIIKYKPAFCILNVLVSMSGLSLDMSDSYCVIGINTFSCTKCIYFTTVLWVWGTDPWFSHITDDAKVSNDICDTVAQLEQGTEN